MQTLQEILDFAKSAQAKYAEGLAQHRQQLEHFRAEAEKAKADAKNAIAAGDQDGYASAIHSKEYHVQRAEALTKEVSSPYFTPEEHNRLVSEARKAMMQELREPGKRLYELRKEWLEAVKDIADVNNKVTQIRACLNETGIPTGFAGSAYEYLSCPGIPSSIGSVGKSRELVRDIKIFYNPEKETSHDE